MTVRVVDARALLGDALDIAASIVPYRAVLLGTTTGIVLDFPYNPESFTESYSPEWADRNLPGRQSPIFDWKRNPAGDLQIDYVLQLDDSAETQSFLVGLRTASLTPNEITGEPERWQFVAGTFDFIGHIGSLSINYVRTTPTGDADTAEIRFTLTENAKGFSS